MISFIGADHGTHAITELVMKPILTIKWNVIMCFICFPLLIYSNIIQIEQVIISPKFENFDDIMFLVAPPPPHANACAGHNFVTNTPIKCIFAIAIEVPDYKNPMIFGINRKNKMASAAAILYKNAQKDCGVSNFVINSPINFIFGIAIDNT